MYISERVPQQLSGRNPTGKSKFIITRGKKVPTDHALCFSRAFYAAYASSQDIKLAFSKGKQKLLYDFKGLDKADLPQLLHANVDSSYAAVREHHSRDLKKKVKAIWKFNYKSQLNQFYQFQRSTCSLCLIHGPTPEYGQTWLMERLTKLKDDHTNTNIFSLKEPPEPIEFRQSVRTIEDLKKILQRRFLLRSEDFALLVEEMAEMIHDTLSNHSHVFRVRNLGQAGRDVIGTFFKDFWRPLVNKLEARSSRLENEARKHHCLLFLLEDQPAASILIDQLNSQTYNDILFEEIEPFSQKTFNEWINEIRSTDWPMSEKYASLSDEEKVLFMRNSQFSQIEGDLFIPVQFLEHLCHHNGLKYTQFVKP